MHEGQQLDATLRDMQTLQKCRLLKALQRCKGSVPYAGRAHLRISLPEL